MRAEERDSKSAFYWLRSRASREQLREDARYQAGVAAQHRRNAENPSYWHNPKIEAGLALEHQKKADELLAESWCPMPPRIVERSVRQILADDFEVETIPAYIVYAPDFGRAPDEKELRDNIPY